MSILVSNASLVLAHATDLLILFLHFLYFDFEVVAHSKLVFHFLGDLGQFLLLIFLLFGLYLLHLFCFSHLPAVLHALGVAFAVSHFLLFAFEFQVLSLQLLVLDTEELFFIHALIFILITATSVTIVHLVLVKLCHACEDVSNGTMASLQSFLEGEASEVVLDVRIYTLDGSATVYLASIIVGLESKKSLDHLFVAIESSIVKGCVAAVVLHVWVNGRSAVLPLLG